MGVAAQYDTPTPIAVAEPYVITKRRMQGISPAPSSGSAASAVGIERAAARRRDAGLRRAGMEGLGAFSCFASYGREQRQTRSSFATEVLPLGQGGTSRLHIPPSFSAHPQDRDECRREHRWSYNEQHFGGKWHRMFHEFYSHRSNIHPEN